MDITHYIIEQELIKAAGDRETMIKRCTTAIESAVDYTLDMEDHWEDLEGCEKSVFGVKFEKRWVVANELPRKRAKSKGLDTVIAGLDIDIKTTCGGNWMIPKEAIDHWCLLLGVDHKKSTYKFGSIFITDDKLNPGKNRDSKRTINKDAKLDSIYWMITNTHWEIEKPLIWSDYFNQCATA